MTNHPHARHGSQCHTARNDGPGSTLFGLVCAIPVLPILLFVAVFRGIESLFKSPDGSQK